MPIDELAVVIERAVLDEIASGLNMHRRGQDGIEDRTSSFCDTAARDVPRAAVSVSKASRTTQTTGPFWPGCTVCTGPLEQPYGDALDVSVVRFRRNVGNDARAAYQLAIDSGHADAATLAEEALTALSSEMTQPEEEAF